jgi:hypothetical protein
MSLLLSFFQKVTKKMVNKKDIRFMGSPYLDFLR